ncbi:hypothetical protein CDL15_Pgr005932 [Punica granatum]|uniref:Putative E3 ubiquitin-protein ligase LIN ARM-like domain-containing protein n=1 Tax=Punica granatum TaxID=22663 RepID=A0A218WFX0_PUNGR|nr:hypothetical protein CDL15_Pgr005932 [Punica granatum]PKI75744.1 hypothetical protein CRG98_003887 [Punica granatum]
MEFQYLLGLSLVTLSWLSGFLPCMEDKDLKSTACSIFVPQMLESINYDRAPEERVLASLSLLNLAKSSGTAGPTLADELYVRYDPFMENEANLLGTSCFV